MMTLVALMVGIGLSASLGWLLLRITEGETPLLGAWERICWSLGLGPTFHMFLVFVLESLGVIRLTLWGMAAPLIMAVAILGIVVWRRRWYDASCLPRLPARHRLLHSLSIPLIVLLLWTGFKLVAAGTDLWIAPTVWDDSFNNWNMRAKVFVEHQAIVLEIPGGNERTIGAEGVNSYPPMLPLLKTWLVRLRGSWEEPLVNAIHLLWLLVVLGAIGCALRRMRGPRTAAIGIIAVTSLPMMLLHGANPYADMLLASHILLAILALLRWQESNAPGWGRILGLIIGLLCFTKNEGLLLYAPLIGGVTIVQCARHGRLRQILPLVLLASSVIVPWLIFKWMNGLTFGNAKAVSDIAFSFNQQALDAILFQWRAEPNFLLLPLAMVLTLVLRHRKLRQHSIGMLALTVVAGIAMQLAMFTMVRELATEAIRQTGVARGQVHVAALAILVVLLAWTKEDDEGVHISD